MELLELIQKALGKEEGKRFLDSCGSIKEAYKSVVNGLLPEFLEIEFLKDFEQLTDTQKYTGGDLQKADLEELEAAKKDLEQKVDKLSKESAEQAAIYKAAVASLKSEMTKMTATQAAKSKADEQGNAEALAKLQKELATAMTAQIQSMRSALKQEIMSEITEKLLPEMSAIKELIASQKPTDLTPILKAIKALKPTDLSPVLKAIAAQTCSTDLSQVLSVLKELKLAHIDENRGGTSTQIVKKAATELDAWAILYATVDTEELRVKFAWKVHRAFAAEKGWVIESRSEADFINNIKAKLGVAFS